eukprot:GHVR01014921.1.p1 GENE.GHVR01014921.1~~GHVR01014921.1.p1  ORF type:complete len:109 (+),score=20.98 GHVR01014921.1:66-392(+)
MAAVSVDSLSSLEKGELLCTYAALVLHDDKVDMTADNLNKVITAAGGKVEPYLPGLFAKCLAVCSIYIYISYIYVILFISVYIFYMNEYYIRILYYLLFIYCIINIFL